MRISDWSSDVCSSDLLKRAIARIQLGKVQRTDSRRVALQFKQLAFQVLTLVQNVGRALGPVHGRLQVCESGRELEQRGIGRLPRRRSQVLRLDQRAEAVQRRWHGKVQAVEDFRELGRLRGGLLGGDRKSTRLNSSH